MNYNAFLENDGSSEEEEYDQMAAQHRMNVPIKAEIKISELLFPEAKYEYKLRKPKFRKKQAESMIYEIDDSIKAKNLNVFKEEGKSLSEMYGGSKSAAMKKYFKKKQFEQALLREKNVDEKLQAPFDIIDWEKDIIIDEPSDSRINITTRELVNNIFEEEKWEEQIIYDENSISRFKPFVTLRLNDPNLIFDQRDDRKKSRRKNKEIIYTDRPQKSKYNISNDKYYDFEIVAKSNLGTYGVQHSIPALKLATPFYKTNLTNEELRNFHRPVFKLDADIYKFVKLKESEFRSSNVIKKATEFDLTEETKFHLVEYSEEHPPLIQNIGMISLITNCFRKGNQLEEPVINKYQTTILELDDPSPFYNYGDVRPGESIYMINNNLFRAPLFKHRSNDFLCIARDNQLFLRKIDDILLAGQTLPSEVVYSPNSRKFNVYCKNRLKNTVYRYFQRRDCENDGIPSSFIDELFSHFSEGSKRKWLKEFADIVKKGRETCWVLKSGESILSEEDLRKLVTPENVCQYESMLSAERRLLDSGYEVSERFEHEDEIRLAPWHLTRNFINVCNGKGLLELEGKGDPTGVGEGFSFIKVKLKKGNEVEDRKIFNEIQSKYKNIIQKIWNKQQESLSSSKNIEFDEIRDKINELIVNAPKQPTQVIDKSKAYITIKRTFIVNGEKMTEEEEVYDKRIIDGYLQSRKQTKPEDRKSLKCGSCGQLGHMKTNRVCPNFSDKKITIKIQESIRRRARNFLSDKLSKLVSSYFLIQYSSAFHRPVSSKRFPDYRNFISNPIDISVIRTRVKAFKYKTFASFLRDVELLASNCLAYNGPEHSLTKIAQEMIDSAKTTYDTHKNEIDEAERVLQGDNLSESGTHSITE